MSEDILHRLRATNQNPDIQFTPNVYNEAFILIEDICLTIATGNACFKTDLKTTFFDRDLQRETHYDYDELGTFIRTNLHPVDSRTKHLYDRGMRAITEQSGGLFS
ncbi:ATP-dependent DNA helicase [Trichonephila clavipes]|nr:ATP-dependent DNA helicase [Trichonephila clavipes]